MVIIKNGSKIKFTSDYSDNSGEIFIVSQWDEEKNRGWAGDKNGRGWYFHSFQVLVKNGNKWIPADNE